jgi:hypothetical protein
MKEIVQNEPAAFIFEKAGKPSKSFIIKQKTFRALGGVLTCI